MHQYYRIGTGFCTARWAQIRLAPKRPRWRAMVQVSIPWRCSLVAVGLLPCSTSQHSPSDWAWSLSVAPRSGRRSAEICPGAGSRTPTRPRNLAVASSQLALFASRAYCCPHYMVVSRCPDAGERRRLIRLSSKLLPEPLTCLRLYFYIWIMIFLS